MMKNNGLDRRDFLRLTAVSGAALAAAASFPAFSWANVKKVTLEECLAMSPENMAKNSKLVTDSMDYIRMAVGTIRNKDLRPIFYRCNRTSVIFAIISRGAIWI